MTATKTEPALFVALVVAILNIAINLLGLDIGGLDPDTVEAIAGAVVTLIGGWLIRQRVMPVNTINQAGLTTTVVKERAADPYITPVEE